MKLWNTKRSACLGVGKYGQPVGIPFDNFGKLVLVTGSSRTGKTRVGNSVARQVSAGTGAGQIVICGKPDPSFEAEKARDAERLGRSFLHFTMTPGGGIYQRAHPYSPPRPCHYDPLSRGSGASRANMLVNSVAHNPEAEVYHRNAVEISGLCWDIARYNGFDLETDPDTGAVRKRRSLDVLTDMLEPETLDAQAKILSPELMLRHHPHMQYTDAESMVNHLRSRALSIVRNEPKTKSTVGSSIADLQSMISNFIGSSAFYPQSLSEGSAPALRIDLLRAIVRGEIILFSLPAAEYLGQAQSLTALILLDLQSTIATLREFKRQFSNKKADDTPWPPVILQLEEFGSLANAAGATALIGLVNKAADVGLIPIASTQALADIRKVGDNYLEPLIANTSDIVTLQIGQEEDDTDICEFSGHVNKKIATEDIEVTNNRLGLFTGAKQSATVRATDTESTRVPKGAAQALASIRDDDYREMLWITTAPKLTAVHSCGPEGPNNWHETLQMVPVDEPPLGYTPFANPTDVERSELAARIETLRRINDEWDPDGLLARVRAFHTVNLEPTNVDDLRAEIDDVSTPAPPPATVQVPDDDIPLPDEPVDDETIPAPHANPFRDAVVDDSDDGLL